MTLDPSLAFKDDDQLLAGVAAGDRAAFAELFRRRRKDIFAFAMHMVGGREVAEDVTQDVFLAVLRDAARYVPGRTRAVSWLCGIARNITRQVTSVNISDPVQGVSYVLNPQTRTAYRSSVIVTFSTKTDDKTTVTVAPQELKQGRATWFAAGPGGAAGGFVAAVSVTEANVKKEDLGQQTIGGIAANGSRITTTIPAGSIGNEQPIEIVSEQWLAPDLQVLVQTKHTDPRTGETTYRLNNIVRAEPARSLFELPPDYTLQQNSIRKEGLR